MTSLGLGQRGVAVTVTVVVVVIAGASVGAPVAVDEADTQPDNPLYGLEKAGETIKAATYAGGQQWDIARAEERTGEFKNMVEKGKAEKYKGLVDKARNRLINAAKKAKDNEGLQRAKNALKKHIEVLENMKDKVPNVAKPTISLAISASARGQAVLSDVESGGMSASAVGGIPEMAKQKLDQVKEQAQNLEKEIEENFEKAQNRAQVAKQITSRVELKTGKFLSEKLEKARKRGKADEYLGFAEEACERFDAAAEAAADENGLERAREAIEKHLRVLENVKEDVPKQAKVAISLAISRSSKDKAVVASVAARIAAGRPGGKKLSEDLKETLKNQLRESKQETEQLRERVQENLEKGVPENKIVSNIALSTANSLMKEMCQMCKENKCRAVPEVSEEVRARINAAYSAAVDNKGLTQAIQASHKHLSALENVRKKVPEEAKNAIQKSIRRSRTHVEVLKNLRKQKKPTPRNIRQTWENIIEQIPKGVISETLEKSPEWTWLPENYEIVVGTWEENFVKVLVPEELENLVPADFSLRQKGLPDEYSEPFENWLTVVETWGKDYVKVLIPLYQPTERQKQRGKGPSQENQGKSTF